MSFRDVKQRRLISLTTRLAMYRISVECNFSQLPGERARVLAKTQPAIVELTFTLLSERKLVVAAVRTLASTSPSEHTL